MGFTKTTYNLTVHKLEHDGQGGGYWWLNKQLNGPEVYNIGWTDNTVESAAPLFGRNTFKTLIAAMIQNNLALPTGDVKIDIDSIAEQQQLNTQFQAPELTTQDLQTIAANFDIVDFLVKFGVFLLVRRCYLEGIITLAQLADVLIGLGQQDKITKQRAENVTNILLQNGDITQAQYNAFWNRWDNEVGT